MCVCVEFGLPSSSVQFCSLCVCAKWMHGWLCRVIFIASMNAFFILHWLFPYFFCSRPLVFVKLAFFICIIICIFSFLFSQFLALFSFDTLIRSCLLKMCSLAAASVCFLFALGRFGSCFCHSLSERVQNILGGTIFRTCWESERNKQTRLLSLCYVVECRLRSLYMVVCCFEFSRFHFLFRSFHFVRLWAL